MREQANFYSVLYADVRYSKELNSDAKILYCEITALSNKQGFCWASNKHFRDHFGWSESSIRRYLRLLKECGFIRIQYEDDQGFTRKIFIRDPKKRGVKTPESPTEQEIPGGQSPMTGGQSPVTGGAVTHDRGGGHQWLGGRSPVTGNNNISNTIKEREGNDSFSPFFYAFDWLEQNHALKLDTDIRVQKLRTQIRNWPEFINYYNNRVEEKDMEFKYRPLVGYLINCGNSWLKMTEKLDSDHTPVTSVKPIRLNDQY